MGLTKPRAAQIFNLDYKQSTRVVTTVTVTLSGGAPSSVDGVSLSVGDRVLVTAQTTGSQNGLYYVVTVGSGTNGTWARTSDGNDTGEIEAGMIVMVTEGAIYADTQWKLITDDPITIGTTTLTFTQNYSANSIAGGTSNVRVFSNANVTISSAGTANVLNISSTGTVTTGTASVTGNIIGGNANITGTTAATSKTTGALVVGGGVGVASDVWAGNSVTVDGGAYGNVVITQFASVFATGVGSNPRSIMQVRGADNVSGIGIQGVSSGNGQIYANTGIIFTTGATLRDKDFPTGGTTRATIDSTGLAVTGIISASGNVTGNYFLGNVFYANGITASKIYNGTSEANVGTSGGNANISIGGTSNVVVFASTGEYVSGLLSVTGNILTGGLISATGNVTGNYILGNVFYASGITASKIYNGTSEVNVGTSGGNANISIGGTSNVAVFSNTGAYFNGNLVPAVSNTYSLGSSTNRWANLWLTGNTIYLGNSTITSAASGDVIIDSAGSFAVPVGTTAQRSAVQGAIRYNTTAGAFETFDGVGWNTLAYGTQTDFPFGDYGSVTSAATTDAFGVSVAATFDCNSEGPFSINDLATGEAWVGA
jgi:hypothetical protein